MTRSEGRTASCLSLHLRPPLPQVESRPAGPPEGVFHHGEGVDQGSAQLQDPVQVLLRPSGAFFPGPVQDGLHLIPDLPDADHGPVDGLSLGCDLRCQLILGPVVGQGGLQSRVSSDVHLDTPLLLACRQPCGVAPQDDSPALEGAEGVEFRNPVDAGIPEIPDVSVHPCPGLQAAFPLLRIRLRGVGPDQISTGSQNFQANLLLGLRVQVEIQDGPIGRILTEVPVSPTPTQSCGPDGGAVPE